MIKILILDDEKKWHELHKKGLNDDEFTFICTRSGKKAINILKNDHSIKVALIDEILEFKDGEKQRYQGVDVMEEVKNWRGDDLHFFSITSNPMLVNTTHLDDLNAFAKDDFNPNKPESKSKVSYKKVVNKIKDIIDVSFVKPINQLREKAKEINLIFITNNTSECKKISQKIFDDKTANIIKDGTIFEINLQPKKELPFFIAYVIDVSQENESYDFYVQNCFHIYRKCQNNSLALLSYSEAESEIKNTIRRKIEDKIEIYIVDLKEEDKNLSSQQIKDVLKKIDYCLEMQDFDNYLQNNLNHQMITDNLTPSGIDISDIDTKTNNFILDLYLKVYKKECKKETLQVIRNYIVQKPLPLPFNRLSKGAIKILTSIILTLIIIGILIISSFSSLITNTFSYYIVLLTNYPPAHGFINYAGGSILFGIMYWIIDPYVDHFSEEYYQIKLNEHIKNRLTEVLKLFK